VIHVGLQTRTQAEVTDGLKEGENIYVSRPRVNPSANGNTQQSNNNRANAPRVNRGPQL